MAWHILIKLTKIKHTERILKPSREKKKKKTIKRKARSNIQGKPHMFNSWFFSRNSAGQKGMEWYI